jgi:hypothetical protein
MTARLPKTNHRPSRAALMGAAFASILLLGGVGAATACEGSKVLFEEEFDDNLCNWPCGPRGKIEDGKFTLHPKEGNYNVSTILPGYFFGDADMCLNFKFAQVPEGEKMAAGLLFWAQNYDNNYGVKVYSNGQVTIWREKDHKFNWLKVIKESPAVNTGMGSENLIRVTTDGDKVTVYVNGDEVHKFRAQKPANDAKIGLWVQGAKGLNVAEFDEIKITNVEK